MHPRTPIAVAIDTAIVVAFVAIGRRNHDEGEAIADVARTAAPFLLALVTAWVVLRVDGKPIWQNPTAIAAGIVAWMYTLVGGMLLRRFVFDDGTALSFVIVAAVFLGTFLVGWRAVANALTSRARTGAIGR